MKAFINTFDPQTRPNRHQTLFVSLSKHLYLTKDDSVKRQDKDLDPHTCGERRLLKRYVILDVDTGQVYGEYHEAGQAPHDLLGFLARAWARKKHNHMHGLPSQLNIPQSVWNDDDAASALREVSGFDVMLAPTQGGFGGGIHAVRNFEKRAYELKWSMASGDKLPFKFIQMASAIIGQKASSSDSPIWHSRWDEVPEVPLAFTAMMDARYEIPKAWSLGYYGYGIHGEIRWE